MGRPLRGLPHLVVPCTRRAAGACAPPASSRRGPRAFSCCASETARNGSSRSSPCTGAPLTLTRRGAPCAPTPSRNPPRQPPVGHTRPAPSPAPEQHGQSLRPRPECEPHAAARAGAQAAHRRSRAASEQPGYRLEKVSSCSRGFERARYLPPETPAHTGVFSCGERRGRHSLLPRPAQGRRKLTRVRYLRRVEPTARLS